VATTDHKTESVRVRVTPSEKAWLQRYAALDDRSVHYVLRRALLEFYAAHADELDERVG
jgi:hypothetical protein